jgi:DNA polymerase elongation subunit (family B)
MKFYTSVNQYGNRVLVRGINNEKRVQDKIEFKPSLFVKSKSGTKYKSLFGDSLDEIQFESINEAKDYVKRYGEVENFEVFGNTNYAYQYITKTFPTEVEFDITQLAIWSIDIETTVENGFPDTKNPMEEILLITVQDSNSKQITTFGCKSIEKLDLPNLNHNYILCKDEKDLLRKFIAFLDDNHPHVITGWNIEFFDIPYLCARISRMLDDDALKAVSPWRVVNAKEFTRNGKTELTYDIMGVAILDYLDLYKKFTYGAQESYKLDHISKVELGEGKLENPYTSFKEFYTKDWQLFVKYNVIDVRRVDQLEDKMKLIELILTMAYDAKCNFVDVFSAVRTWDCILYNHLWNQNIVVHQREGKPARQIVGAYVQEPIPGKYDWVVSFDATSLYPSIIMQYNMSPETIEYSETRSTTVDDMMAKKYNLDELVTKDYCMAANGYSYRRDKQGLFPEITQKLFDDRQKYKKLMLTAQAKYEETKDKALLKDISKYNNFQMARKIQLNSLFGAWGNEFFRFYDSNIAEGITITGQYIIREVGKSLDDYLNKICGTKDFNYSFYSDTDSCYITLDPLVQKFYKDQPKEKIIDILDKICNDKIVEAINKTCDSLANYTNAFDKKIYFKREAIADRGIWVAKKRYALNVYDNEGVRYKEAKLKVMGLEIVRSSTPEPCRDALKAAVKLVLTSDEQTLQDYILDFEQKYRAMPAELIAFPRGVNGLNKYTDRSSIYAQGCPIHVRGSLLYNYYLKQNDLGNKYETIAEGDKIKFVYLKEPNTMKENVIAFISAIPDEFKVRQYIDYDTMFSKSFIEPLTTILNGVGWSSKPQASLEGLFS